MGSPRLSQRYLWIYVAAPRTLSCRMNRSSRPHIRAEGERRAPVLISMGGEMVFRDPLSNPPSLNVLLCDSMADARSQHAICRVGGSRSGRCVLIRAAAAGSIWQFSRSLYGYGIRNDTNRYFPEYDAFGRIRLLRRPHYSKHSSAFSKFGSRWTIAPRRPNEIITLADPITDGGPSIPIAITSLILGAHQDLRGKASFVPRCSTGRKSAKLIPRSPYIKARQVRLVISHSSYNALSHFRETVKG